MTSPDLQVVSISTIGLYISYMIPIFLRLTICRQTFVSGPFSLGIFSIPVGVTAVLWVLFITVRTVTQAGAMDCLCKFKACLEVWGHPAQWRWLLHI